MWLGIERYDFSVGTARTVVVSSNRSPPMSEYSLLGRNKLQVEQHKVYIR